jgi:putative sigma-54 modulation protein
MKLQMNAVGFTADIKLLDFIQKKADKLDTFFDRIQDGEVFLKLEKGEHARENKAVEIRLNVPGTVLFAKEQNTSFEAAADAAIESLKRQVSKYKEKITAHH